MKKLIISLLLFPSLASAVTTYYTPDKDSLEFGAASGRRTGYSRHTAFGETDNVDQDVDTAIWSGANTGIAQLDISSGTTARTMKIYSASARDDDGLDGCTRVLIKGVDFDQKFSSESITMDGTGLVSSATTYLGINSAICTDAGSRATNVGNIFVGFRVDDTTAAVVIAGTAHSSGAVFFLAETHNAYMTRWYGDMNRASGATTSVDLHLEIRRQSDVEFSPVAEEHERGITRAGDSGFEHPFVPWFKIAGPATIIVHGEGSAADLDVSAGFELVLEEKQ